MKTLWSVPFLFGTLGVMLNAGTLHAQNLGLEGGTGVFVTPLAYTVASPKDNVGKPVVGFHFVDADNIVGTFSKLSVTVGAFDRLEFGYTRDVHTTGDHPALSPLWNDGFNIVHGKVNIVRENSGKRSWIPALSTGFVLRTQVQNVGGAIADEDTNNHDVYVVATKTITHIKRFPPIIVSGGVRGTNAQLWGMAGNAERYQARAFGAAAVQLKGPFGSTLVLGSEVAQQPRRPEHLSSAVIPTTLTYALRIVPFGKRKFNIDFGVAQIANRIMPDVELKARRQFAMGISYGF